MASKDDQVLRTAKEIVVKFIEVGRVSPTNFEGAFKEIYRSVYEALHFQGDLSELKEDN